MIAAAKKCILAALTAAVFAAAFLPLRVGADAGGVSVRIISAAPAAGVPLETALSGADAASVTYRWTVAAKDVGVSAASYTPSAADYEAWIAVSVLDRATGALLAEDRVYFSPLPVVYIDTANGREIRDRIQYVPAAMRVQGNGEFGPQYDGEIRLRGRGTSSWHYDKKPYKLKFEEPVDLFGFGDSCHYVLLSSYLDPSLLRNAVAYDLSEALGLTATDSIWVDLVFNGEYAGSYQLCEQIRIGAQLVDIRDWEAIAAEAAGAICAANPTWFAAGPAPLAEALQKDLSWITTGRVTFAGRTYTVSDYYTVPADITGGYLFELDSSYEKDVSHFTTENGIKVGVSMPEAIYTNLAMAAYVESFFQDFEDALTSADGYNARGQHYTELADFDSMVSFWLTMELLSNEDAATRSRFCYKDAGGKLTFGPVWDFDIGGGSFRSFFDAEQWSVTGTVVGWYEGQDFWKEVVDDPYFQIRAQERYWSIRPYLAELVADGGIIDGYADAIYESGAANELLWSGDGYMTRTFSGPNGDVAVLKDFLTRRFAWLDTVFDTEDSTTKALWIPSSAAPYVRSGRVRFAVAGAAPDEAAHGADFLIGADAPLRLTVSTVPGSVTRLYVNGLLYGSYSAAELSGGIEIPAAALTAEAGTKNVISAITGTGSRTYTNYTTVKVRDAAAPPVPAEAGTPPDPCADGGHRLSHVAGRAATEERYGLRECWYCETCRHYFADDGGTVRLSAAEVILPGVVSDAPGGVLSQILRTEGVVLAALVVSGTAVQLLVLRVRKKRK